MQKRASRSLFGPLIALSLVAVPAIASVQDDRYASKSSHTYSSDYHSGMTAGKIAVMQCIIDKDISGKDLEKVLPLLHDLRDARRLCDTEHDTILNEMVLEKSSTQKMSGDSRMRDCEQKFVERRNEIWNTISDKIGSDKANGLRRLVEPMTEDLSRVAYTNERLQRIDTIVAEWDRLATARVAANGGTPWPEVSGVRTVSVTTTTTTQRPGSWMVVTTPAKVTEHDLVKVVEQRIVANELGNSEYLILTPQHRDLTTADMTFLRENKMRIWW